MTTTYRLADQDDGPAIFDLLIAMHAENALASLSEPKVAGTVAYVIEHGIPIVAERDGLVIATAGLIVNDWWYSQEQFLRDLWFYVHADHRRGKVADGLIRHARTAAELWGLPLVLSVLTREKAEAKCKLFARHMMQVGGIFYEGR